MTVIAEPLRAKNAHIWERDPHDFYIEEKWCSERLFEAERFYGEVWDPACGSGRIVMSARAAGLTAFGTDIVDRGFPGTGLCDFLTQTGSVASVVTNPPFKHARRFVEHALTVMTRRSAFLLPTSWLNGSRRSRWLETTPLAKVWVLTPRPSMPPGRLIEAGMEPGQGRVDFSWFVFDVNAAGPPTVGWLRR